MQPLSFQVFGFQCVNALEFGTHGSCNEDVVSRFLLVARDVGSYIS